MANAAMGNDGGAARPLRVFIVENHADTRTLLCLLLESLGHVVESAETMTDALQYLAGTPCDVLISDIGLPDGDGWQLMERLKPLEPIYAVAMSGYGMTADRARSRAVGFRHHLVKPYGIEELPKVLREAARERQARCPSLPADAALPVG